MSLCLFNCNVIFYCAISNSESLMLNVVMFSSTGPEAVIMLFLIQCVTEQEGRRIIYCDSCGSVTVTMSATTFPPQNCPFWGSNPHLIQDPESAPQNGTSIGSAIFAGLKTYPTDGLIDRPTTLLYSMCSNEPLWLRAMQPKNGTGLSSTE